MIPVSLYIHTPWCLRKCPYCDFNSHKKPEKMPEWQYIERLIDDLEQDHTRFQNQPLMSIFIGGGTPSLFSAEAYAYLLEQVRRIIPFAADIEITLEANPGTVEQDRFKAYRDLGINRLSIGIQSFDTKHLKQLGRVHDGMDAHRAIDTARSAGFEQINLDLMHGLPGQSLKEGLTDLTKAIQHEPEHISWYQLTIEPNTVFYKTQPTLPKEEEALALEEEGLLLLQKHHYHRYEISAFCRGNNTSKHNLNYWLFGDYYGIGAGAHGKLTNPVQNQIFRTQKRRQPIDYLDSKKTCLIQCQEILTPDLAFEFVLNTSRLEAPIPYQLWTERTGLQLEVLMPRLKLAEQQGLIQCSTTHWQVTPFGRRFTNNLQLLFMP